MKKVAIIIAVLLLGTITIGCGSATGQSAASKALGAPAATDKPKKTKPAEPQATVSPRRTPSPPPRTICPSRHSPALC